HDRAGDNWRPLLAIADAAGGAWPQRARDSALTLSAQEGGDGSIRVMLLADLRSIFADQGTDRLPSEALCESLAKMEGRPWPEWKGGRPLTQNQLARQLKPFEIIPRTIRALDGETFPGGKSTAKGYKLVNFEDAFDRYLPREEGF